ncbi:hypothetical protein BAE44_0005154 [Dichanthelium oligosanthes]|uniref:Uncharacterized protein n=1 Tax=Dichanthelium oligosanthes TaxID=888268 RepID=A0A1E5W9A8_9POAL|nr:hypothetical protein BAE44_0005154 [Dichanthelium oligosanthes]
MNSLDPQTNVGPNIVIQRVHPCMVLIQIRQTDTWTQRGMLQHSSNTLQNRR